MIDPVVLSYVTLGNTVSLISMKLLLNYLFQEYFLNLNISFNLKVFVYCLLWKIIKITYQELFPFSLIVFNLITASFHLVLSVYFFI